MQIQTMELESSAAPIYRAGLFSGIAMIPLSQNFLRILTKERIELRALLQEADLIRIRDRD
jgi:hypothetical protein